MDNFSVAWKRMVLYEKESFFIKNETRRLPSSPSSYIKLDPWQEKRNYSLWIIFKNMCSVFSLFLSFCVYWRGCPVDRAFPCLNERPSSCGCRSGAKESAQYSRGEVKLALKIKSPCSKCRKLNGPFFQYLSATILVLPDSLSRFSTALQWLFTSVRFTL